METIVKYATILQEIRDRLVRNFPHTEAAVFEDFIDKSIERRNFFEDDINDIQTRFFRNVYTHLHEDEVFFDLDCNVLKRIVSGTAIIDWGEPEIEEPLGSPQLPLEEFNQQEQEQQQQQQEGDVEQQESPKKKRHQQFRYWPQELQQSLKEIWESHSPYCNKDTFSLTGKLHENPITDRQGILHNVDNIIHLFYERHSGHPYLRGRTRLNYQTVKNIAKSNNFRYSP